MPASYLHRLHLSAEGAAELYLQLLCRLGAHRQLVLLLDVGGDGVVHVVAGYSYGGFGDDAAQRDHGYLAGAAADIDDHGALRFVDGHPRPYRGRSEEHTSELQSRQYLVCRLLLEKK